MELITVSKQVGKFDLLHPETESICFHYHNIDCNKLGIRSRSINVSMDYDWLDPDGDAPLDFSNVLLAEMKSHRYLWKPEDQVSLEKIIKYLKSVEGIQKKMRKEKLINELESRIAKDTAELKRLK